MRLIIITMMLSVFIATSYADGLTFALKSKAFADNHLIPSTYTCDGRNISPELNWENLPEKTASLVLILFSADWPDRNVYLWVLYNIPPSIKTLPEGANKKLPDGILTGNNYFEEVGYRGPCPPDSFFHHYVFVLFAMDEMLDLPDGVDFDELVENMRGHVLKKVRLTAIYKH